MVRQYKFEVAITDYVTEREGELCQCLRIFHPGAGNNFFTEFFEKVQAGQEPVVYQTNDGLDARRKAQTLMTMGASVAIHEW